MQSGVGALTSFPVSARHSSRLAIHKSHASPMSRYQASSAARTSSAVRSGGRPRDWVAREISSRASERAKRGQTLAFSQASSNTGADFNQLREKRDLERLSQEGDPGRAAGAALEADDALDRLHVAEAPELEVLLDVDQLLAHVVLGPVGLRVFVDGLEHFHHARMHRVRLRPVALHT